MIIIWLMVFAQQHQCHAREPRSSEDKEAAGRLARAGAVLAMSFTDKTFPSARVIRMFRQCRLHLPKNGVSYEAIHGERKREGKATSEQEPSDQIKGQATLS